MGLTEVLTLIFITLKLTGVIDWSWWLVLLPEIIAVGFYAVYVLIISLLAKSLFKSHKRKGRM